MEDRKRSGLGWGVFEWKKSENDDIIDKVNESLMEEQL